MTTEEEKIYEDELDAALVRYETEIDSFLSPGTTAALAELVLLKAIPILCKNIAAEIRALMGGEEGRPEYCEALEDAAKLVEEIGK